MAHQCACLFRLLIEWGLDLGAVCIRANDTGLTAVL